MEENVKQYLAFKKGEIKLPEHMKPRKELSSRIFKNVFLEKFTRTPIWLPIVMYLIIITGLMYYAISSLSLNLNYFAPVLVGGFLFWTFMEYMIHRFVYHTESNSRLLYRIQFTGHTVHHQHPIDPTRLAMPPLPSIILSSIFFGIFYLLMGEWAFIFWSGFMLGYLVYISFHYLQHTIKSPMIPTLKKLWLFHQIHHYQDPYSAFGVSTLLWDRVFGTLPKIKSGKTKKD
jgi:sterol desaturase/sphingolipid hydroxylase (fatty acid hydroxylase superfamily)